MLQLGRNLTESQITELIRVLSDPRFQTCEVPASLWEYERLKKYSLPTLQRVEFQYTYKDNDGKVCEHFCFFSSSL